MADSVVNLKAAMQQGWRPGGIQDDPGPAPEPDTWWGGFTQQLGRELNLPGMIDSATIRPRETTLDTLAQFLPYLGTPAPGTPSATALVKNLRSRTVPTHAEGLAAGAEKYAAAKGPRSPAQIAANTVELRPTPTGPPSAGGAIEPPISMAELDRRVAANRAAIAAKRPISLSDITPEVVDDAGQYTSAGLPEIEPPISMAEMDRRVAARRGR